MDEVSRKKFMCRHCNQTVNVEGKTFIHEGEHINVAVIGQGAKIESYMCNLCGGMNIFISTKHYTQNTMLEITKNIKGKVNGLHVFPTHFAPKKIKYVPSQYMNEYNDARIVLDISCKACALLCRRIMETVLEKECNCTQFHLSKKITEFNEKYNPPELLKKSMRYIIDAGNASAHDNINANNDLIKINHKDCEELLEAVVLLFDVVFIQPRKAEELEKRLVKVAEIPKSKTNSRVVL